MFLFPTIKNSFFLEFLELIGAEYKREKADGFELTEQQKKILDDRLKAEKEEFVPAREAQRKLREKYGL